MSPSQNPWPDWPERGCTTVQSKNNSGELPLWRNTTTKPVCDYPSSSRKRCPPSVTPIESTNPTWCVVRLLSSFRLTMRTPRIMGSWCSCDWKEYSYHSDIPRILHPQKTLFPSIQGLFRGYRRTGERVGKRWWSGDSYLWGMVRMVLCFDVKGESWFRNETPPSPVFYGIISLWGNWPQPSAWPLPCFLEVRGD